MPSIVDSSSGDFPAGRFVAVCRLQGCRSTTVTFSPAFTIQRLLGVGGMGEVYLAQHPRLPRLDALKILSMDATHDEEFRARFTREAELAATLWHPHIVGRARPWRVRRPAVDIDGLRGGHRRPSPGGAELPDRGCRMREVVEIVTAVAEALDFAHERRLLHRDVKPANILVTTPAGQRATTGAVDGFRHRPRSRRHQRHHRGRHGHRHRRLRGARTAHRQGRWTAESISTRSPLPRSTC